MARLSDYQNSPMSDNDLQAFIRSVCQICGRSAYLVEPSLKEYVGTAPTLKCRPATSPFPRSSTCVA